MGKFVIADEIRALTKAVESGGGSSLPSLDSIAFGDSPTLPEEGKTDPTNYEDIAEAINTALARGNAVTLEDVTISSNGTTTAPAGKAFKSVVTNVPQPPAGAKVYTLTSADGSPVALPEGFSDSTFESANVYAEITCGVTNFESSKMALDYCNGEWQATAANEIGPGDWDYLRLVFLISNGYFSFDYGTHYSGGVNVASINRFILTIFDNRGGNN